MDDKLCGKFIIDDTLVVRMYIVDNLYSVRVIDKIKPGVLPNNSLLHLHWHVAYKLQ